VGAAWFADQEQPVGIGDVTGLAAALDGKAASGHLHEGVYAAVGHDHDAAYQAKDAELTAIAGLTGEADRTLYFTGPGAAALTPMTAFGRAVAGSADAAAGRAALGLGGAATREVGTSGDAVPLLSGGASFAGIVASGGLFVPEGASRRALSFATQNSFTRDQIYVAASGSTTGGISGTMTVPTGSLVTGVGMRFVNRGVTGYGWTFEKTGANTAAPAIVAELDIAGNFLTRGQMRAASLRIDAEPAAAAAAATHKLPVNLNGTTYYLLLSSS